MSQGILSARVMRRAAAHNAAADLSADLFVIDSLAVLYSDREPESDLPHFFRWRWNGQGALGAMYAQLVREVDDVA